MVDLSAKGVGNRIRIRREARGLSQPKLAKLLGIPQQTIGGWEKGTSKRPRYLIEAAKALWTTPEWILREEGPEEVIPADKAQLEAMVDSLDPNLIPAAIEALMKLKASRAA